MRVIPLRGSVMTLAVWLCAGMAPGAAANPPAAQAGHAPTPATAAPAGRAEAPKATPARVAAKPAAGHAAKGGEVIEDATKAEPLRPGSIAAAHAAVHRAVASVQGAGAGEKAAVGAAHVPLASTRPIARAKVPAARAPAAAARRAPSVVLRWGEAPTGTRQLAWDVDIDPRAPEAGVRLVWRPDVP